MWDQVDRDVLMVSDGKDLHTYVHSHTTIRGSMVRPPPSVPFVLRSLGSGTCWCRVGGVGRNERGAYWDRLARSDQHALRRSSDYASRIAFELLSATCNESHMQFIQRALTRTFAYSTIKLVVD